MAKRAAKYKTRTDDAVQQALIRLIAKKPLSDVTVSELAREAGVSRSTIYGHYDNVADVYDALVDEVSKDMAPLMSQVMCSSSFGASKRPFCALIRNAGELAPVVDDARFADAVLSRGWTQEGHDLYDVLLGAGYSDEQARAVCAFQMSGCLSAARSVKASDEDWAAIRAVIDRFILGGIAACLAAGSSSG